jgi:hypothetical protein
MARPEFIILNYLQKKSLKKRQGYQMFNYLQITHKTNSLIFGGSTIFLREMKITFLRGNFATAISPIGFMVLAMPHLNLMRRNTNTVYLVLSRFFSRNLSLPYS